MFVKLYHPNENEKHPCLVLVLYRDTRNGELYACDSMHIDAFSDWLSDEHRDDVMRGLHAGEMMELHMVPKGG